ncbi:MAG: MBL fold metallo-hydrolase [Candidatus Aenigmarchaeota archaeon]|nr:MBL fold metallo-hydrolase [Candidatus Aenigmarchaeota archaeon]
MLDGIKNPILIAEEHCLTLSDDYYPCVSNYHQKKAKTYKAVDGSEFKINPLNIKATKADHYAPTVGFRIEGTKTICYAGDGTYYKGQEKNYDGCDILILNVLVPKGKIALLRKHMSVDEAIKLINRIENKPELVIIQHFSFWMLRSGLQLQIKAIRDATGVKVIAAEDFMEVDLNTLNTRELKA